MRTVVAAVVAVGLVTSLLGGCTDAKPKPTPPTARPAGGLPAAYQPYAGGVSRPVAEPIYPAHGNDGLDVLHYGLELNWSVGTTTLTGTATLQIRPIRDAAAIRLDFKPYHLDRVTLDGRAVTAAPRGGRASPVARRSGGPATRSPATTSLR